MLKKYLRQAKEFIAPPRLHILGLTRFSLVTQKTLSSFEATRRLSFKAAKELIYDAARMEERFRLFEAVCLPTYRMMHAQYRHSLGIVLVGESMPKQYLQRLRSLTSGGAIRIVKVSSTQSASDAVDRVISKLRDRDRVYSYRLDDDDALSVDFLQIVRSCAKIVSDGTIVSLDLGLSLRRVSDDGFSLEERDHPMLAIGLGTFCRPSAPIHPLAMGNHARIKDKGIPVHHIRKPGQWLRLSHEFSDSKARMNPMRSPPQSLNKLLPAIGGRFPQISSAHLAQMPQFELGRC